MKFSVEINGKELRKIFRFIRELSLFLVKYYSLSKLSRHFEAIETQDDEDSGFMTARYERKEYLKNRRRAKPNPQPESNESFADGLREAREKENNPQTFKDLVDEAAENRTKAEKTNA
jgi:hypothetical protein